MFTVHTASSNCSSGSSSSTSSSSSKQVIHHCGDVRTRFHEALTLCWHCDVVCLWVLRTAVSAAVTPMIVCSITSQLTREVLLRPKQMYIEEV
eukprot:17958-Heterococcus_DN1.PRE.1